MTSQSVAKTSFLARCYPLFKQLVLLFIFWELGCALHQYVLPTISAGILGMFSLLLALFCKIIRLDQIELGAQLLLQEIILFFLPLAVAVIQYKQLFIQEGWQLVLSILIGTCLVMLSTSLTIHCLYRLQGYLKSRRLSHVSH